MKVCFACKKELDDSDTYLNAFKLDKEGIAIPIGMKDKDVICNECFVKEKSLYKAPGTLYVNPNVKQFEIHDKVLTPEEISEIYKRGPPKVDDGSPHLISHRDERDGYLWIDGKKVKKDNPKNST
jgi:hypothetical protein